MIAIAKLTFMRAREPAMLLLFLFGAILAFFLSGTEVVVFFRESKVGDAETGTAGVYLGTCILVGLGLLITIFNATSEIPRDINSRLISVLLSKPLSRFQYVMGKFAGTLAVTGSITLVWVTILLISRSFSIDAQPPGLNDIIAQYLCLLSLLPTCAFATSVSCFFSDIVSMIITWSYIFISSAMCIAPIISALSGEVFGKLVLFISLFFPNFMYFFQNSGTLPSVVGLLIYSLSLALLFIIIGVARFNQGDVFTRD